MASVICQHFRQYASCHFRAGQQDFVSPTDKRLHCFCQIFRLVCRRHAVCLEAVEEQLLICSRPYDSNLYMTKRPCIKSFFIDPLKKSIYSVLTGKYNPVIFGKFFNPLINTCPAVIGGFNFDGRNLRTECPQVFQHFRQPGSLRAGTGNDHMLSEKRLIVIPAQLLAKVDYIPDNKYGWRLDAIFLDCFRRLSKCSGIRFLIGTGTPADKRRRCVCAFSVTDQFFGNMLRTAYAHKKHKRIHSARQFFPMNVRMAFCRILMSRDNGKGCRHLPVGHRNTRISGSRNRRRHSRHFLKVHACRTEHFDFFSPAPKNKGVSPF